MEYIRGTWSTSGGHGVQGHLKTVVKKPVQTRLIRQAMDPGGYEVHLGSWSASLVIRVRLRSRETSGHNCLHLSFH
jgi:hypothetical protein